MERGRLTCGLFLFRLLLRQRLAFAPGELLGASSCSRRRGSSGRSSFRSACGERVHQLLRLELDRSVCGAHRTDSVVLVRFRRYVGCRRRWWRSSNSLPGSRIQWIAPSSETRTLTAGVGLGADTTAGREAAGGGGGFAGAGGSPHASSGAAALLPANPPLKPVDGADGTERGTVGTGRAAAGGGGGVC